VLEAELTDRAAVPRMAVPLRTGPLEGAAEQSSRYGFVICARQGRHLELDP
jgi:hypothetical protein